MSVRPRRSRFQRKLDALGCDAPWADFVFRQRMYRAAYLDCQQALLVLKLRRLIAKIRVVRIKLRKFFIRCALLALKLPEKIKPKSFKPISEHRRSPDSMPAPSQNLAAVTAPPQGRRTCD